MLSLSKRDRHIPRSPFDRLRVTLGKNPPSPLYKGEPGKALSKSPQKYLCLFVVNRPPSNRLNPNRKYRI